MVQVRLLRAQLLGEKLLHRDAQSPTTARGAGSAGVEEPRTEAVDKSDRKDMFGDDLWTTKDLGQGGWGGERKERGKTRGMAEWL